MKKSCYLFLVLLLPVVSPGQAKNKLGMLEYLVNATVKIQTVDSVISKDGKEIAYGGYSTGFFFLLDTRKGKVPSIITTRTAVQSAQSLSFFFLEADTAGLPLYGKQRQITIARKDLPILFHPEENVDLALIPINPVLDGLVRQKIRISYHSLDESIIPSDSVMNTLNVTEDLMMIGHPSGIRPEFNGVPFIKKGVSATPIFLDYQQQKEFLADIPLFDGAAGAPVILYQINYNDRYDRRTIAQRLFLVGINYGALSDGYHKKTVPRLTQVLSGQEQASAEKVFDAAIILKSQKILDFRKLLETLKK
ncbi:MAG: hypothetical protein HYU71_10660 [Bacteroidetes bacterium]|nr:hypothetical protein [Bacteroidota bacterium]